MARKILTLIELLVLWAIFVRARRLFRTGAPVRADARLRSPMIAIVAGATVCLVLVLTLLTVVGYLQL